jgi:hypothetical protein
MLLAECTYSMRALFLPGAAESELLLREAAAKVSVIVWCDTPCPAA